MELFLFCDFFDRFFLLFVAGSDLAFSSGDSVKVVGSVGCFCFCFFLFLLLCVELPVFLSGMTSPVLGLFSSLISGALKEDIAIDHYFQVYLPSESSFMVSLDGSLFVREDLLKIISFDNRSVR